MVATNDTQVMTVAEVATWLDVSEAQIRDWIAQGMKATPAGSIGKRGPRNYRIFRGWVTEWMAELAERERRRLAAERQSKAKPTATPRPAAAAKAPRANAASPLGPCPAVKGRGAK